MVPVSPSDFEELVVKPTDSLATAIIKNYVRLPILWWKLYNYMFTASKTFTPEFEEDLCEIIRNRP